MLQNIAYFFPVLAPKTRSVVRRPLCRPLSFLRLGQTLGFHVGWEILNL